MYSRIVDGAREAIFVASLTLRWVLLMRLG
jgi:hypothetical protein